MLLLASSVCGLFKWRQFQPEVILLAVGWHLRFSLSYRDVEELLAERGLLVDHVTVWSGSNPWVLWRRIAGIDRCSTSIISWNRITGQSNVGCAQASIFVHSGELGVRSPATRRSI
jgi:hypothetical protein